MENEAPAAPHARSLNSVRWGLGKPETATPEHLFAAGYAACFGSALVLVAKQHKQHASKAKVTCAVSIGPRDGGGFGLAVKMRVEDKSLPQAELALRSRSPRKDLSLFACNARQCRRRLRRQLVDARVVREVRGWKALAISPKPAGFIRLRVIEESSIEASGDPG